jgi:hypothetical protein
MPPQFITFTGIDARTDLKRCREISMRWPVEWGCLIGGKLGKNRYPVSTVIQDAGKVLRTALHSCNDFANYANCGILPSETYEHNRLQVNLRADEYDLRTLGHAAAVCGTPVIVQIRDAFPKRKTGSWLQFLFDQSGGRGTSPEAYPEAPDDNLVGYAGGLNPMNVADACNRIKARNYWIDMETGVRDENDYLDLDKCEAVCRAVYGAVD